MQWRSAAALMATAATVAVAAGCGGNPSSPSVARLGTSTTSSSGGGNTQASSGDKSDNALKFSQCMRSHGVPNFPDPSSGGGVSITPSMNLNPDSQQFQQARRACQHLIPQGKQLSPAQQAEVQRQMLAFSQCMRAHGLPDFPDPQFSGNTARLELKQSSGLNPNSPQFQRAQSACASKLPNVKGRGGTGTRGPSSGP